LKSSARAQRTEKRAQRCAIFDKNVCLCPTFRPTVQVAGETTMPARFPIKGK
jgi:protein involved in polysaccharide export with SLBB domain